MEYENRVLLSGFLAAVVGGIALTFLTFFEVLPSWALEPAVFSWPIVAGVVGPQLYLAWRGVPPVSSRRGVAAIFLAFAVAIGLQSVLEGRLAVGLAGGIVLVAICYEVYRGYRDALAAPESASAREE